VNTISPLSPTIFDSLVIMEDNIRIARGLERHFEKHNFKVNVVNGKDEALDVLRKSESLIPNFILDINMGDVRTLEGLSLARDIKRERPEAFVVIYTAFGQHKDQAEKFNVDLFLEKNYDYEDDLEHLRSALLKHSEKVLVDNLSRLYSEHTLDANEAAYQEKLKDEAWTTTHEGYCCAFLNGNLILSKKMARIDFLKLVREKFPRKPVFIAKVGEKKKIRRILSPRIKKRVAR
jgi:DNA-binding response OmpR family regulator